MKLSEWFSAEVEPSIDGVYQRDYRHPGFPEEHIVYCKFSKGEWYVYGNSPQEAEQVSCPSFNKNIYWRGISERRTADRRKE